MGLKTTGRLALLTLACAASAAAQETAQVQKPAPDSAPASALGHPRLLFGPEDIDGLREKITREPWRQMYEKLLADADRNDRATGPADPAAGYDQSCLAERHAFLYVLTGDDAWARKSREWVEKRLDDKRAWANKGCKGLTLYIHGVRVALAYDWCHGAPSWDDEFRRRVSSELKRHGEVILKNGGTQQNRSAASNWQGGRYASAGLCFLATDEDLDGKYIPFCHARASQWYSANAGGNGTRGWNTEGLGYTYYPVGNFLGPFAIALARRFPDKDLRKDNPAVRWMLWTCYAATTQSAVGPIRPDFGDDNAGTGGEGTYGQAFYFCPPELVPGLVYAYDRLWGAKGDRSYDPARCGTIYSILFHPGAAVAEKDPMTIPEWTEAFCDTKGNGFMTFRNAYCTDRDQVAQLFLKLRAPGGHGGPDSLSFRIQGADTAWAVGGGRYGVKHAGGDAYRCSQDTLYPKDPDTGVKTSNRTGKILGTPVVRSDGGGYVVATNAMSNVGVIGHTRRFIADFGKDTGADAAYIICDTSANGAFWQMCSLEENAFTTEGNTFTLTARNGATMKGTVLYPAGDPMFKTGTRPRGSDFLTGKNSFLHLQSEDGSYLVVLTVAGKGAAHPEVSATGTWGKEPNGTVRVGGFTATIQGTEVKTSHDRQ